MPVNAVIGILPLICVDSDGFNDKGDGFAFFNLLGDWLREDCQRLVDHHCVGIRGRAVTARQTAAELSAVETGCHRKTEVCGFAARGAVVLPCRSVGAELPLIALNAGSPHGKRDGSSGLDKLILRLGGNRQRQGKDDCISDARGAVFSCQQTTVLASVHSLCHLETKGSIVITCAGAVVPYTIVFSPLPLIPADTSRFYADCHCTVQRGNLGLRLGQNGQRLIDIHHIGVLSCAVMSCQPAAEPTPVQTV